MKRRGRQSGRRCQRKITRDVVSIGITELGRAINLVSTLGGDRSIRQASGRQSTAAKGSMVALPVRGGTDDNGREVVWECDGPPAPGVSLFGRATVPRSLESVCSGVRRSPGARSQFVRECDGPPEPGGVKSNVFVRERRRSPGARWTQSAALFGAATAPSEERHRSGAVRGRPSPREPERRRGRVFAASATLPQNLRKGLV